MGLPVEYEDIVAAAERIEKYVVRTPALPATALNDNAPGRLRIAAPRTACSRCPRPNAPKV